MPLGRTATRIPHVAVLIETSRGYGRGLLDGVASYVRDHGPWSIYFQPQGLGEPPPKWLRTWHGDGILARPDSLEMVEIIRASAVPAIDLRGRLPNVGLPMLGVDNMAVARLAFRHLRERSFQRFGFYGLPSGLHPHMDERRRNFVAEVESAGYECREFALRRPIARVPNWEREQNQLATWLLGLPKPIGVMTCNDDHGQRLLDACRRAGVAVPAEVAVIGVDNDILLCNLSTPKLSSIDVNPAEIGYRAAELLDGLMRGRPAPAQPTFVAPRSVVLRQSSDFLAIDDAELAMVLSAIRERACQGVRVADLIEQLPIPRRAIERRFKALFGHTPKHEMLRVQIERAKQLVIESDLPLAAIADRCGFNSYKYFGDAFFRLTGVRVGAYRHRHRRRSQSQ